MSKFIFPYGIRFQEDGRIEVFPAAELFVLGRNGRGLHAVFHIDSGATTSIMPASDADALGINTKTGKKFIVRGITGEPLVGYRHTASVQFDNHRIKIPVIFIEHIAVPRIIGREDIFIRFGILFDEAKRRTVFVNISKGRRSIDSLCA